MNSDGGAVRLCVLNDDDDDDDTFFDAPLSVAQPNQMYFSIRHWSR